MNQIINLGTYIYIYVFWEFEYLDDTHCRRGDAFYSCSPYQAFTVAKDTLLVRTATKFMVVCLNSPNQNLLLEILIDSNMPTKCKPKKILCAKCHVIWWLQEPY